MEGNQTMNGTMEGPSIIISPKEEQEALIIAKKDDNDSDDENVDRHYEAEKLILEIAPELLI